MNLNSNKSSVYNFAKKFDIKAFERLNLSVDSYVLLTEEMTELLDVHGMPYLVREGISDCDAAAQQVKRKQGRVRDIVYTGKLNRAFGICNLIDAFRLLGDGDLRLVVCGTGDAEDYVRGAAERDRRIFFAGQVDAKSAVSYQENASVLVNPRLPKEAYTRYSFPSKNIEYLSRGVPVVAYYLPGMQPEYKHMLFIPANETPVALSGAISGALKASTEDLIAKRSAADKRLRLLAKDRFAADLIKLMSE